MRSLIVLFLHTARRILKKQGLHHCLKMLSPRSLMCILVFLCCWMAISKEQDLKYKDPNQPLNVRVNDLLRRMTLSEKIGQMSQIERENVTAEVLKKYFIGSVLSGGGSVPSPQASAVTWVNMVNEMQKAALSTRLGIPLIYGIDAVHGHNNVYNATVFPHNVGLGATRDPTLVKKIGAATALEVRATGIPYVFAPCVAVCRDPRWGRCYESYSEDPKVVQEMTEIISGLQGDIPANSSKGVPFVAGKCRSDTMPDTHPDPKQSTIGKDHLIRGPFQLFFLDQIDLIN